MTLPGAAEALAALPEERRAIVTSCTRPLALVRIEASSLEAPAVVVTADDVETGKPDPAPYLLGAQRLGVDPARCLVVEDAVMGLRSGRAAGAATLAVTTTTPAAEARRRPRRGHAGRRPAGRGPGRRQGRAAGLTPGRSSRTNRYRTPVREVRQSSSRTRSHPSSRGACTSSG
ncbi:hypothetical protein GCM10025868_07550 [Angustibacter aerolatus]|uniref:HAD family hydrolase n=1 Tax=Angustibacter aerolatus TaxID=1162965 RepID=A0ABQ6JE97_9ACTN|nr:HAD-IA family hydrolase [Angustibacter aerolatus]GMA85505.1 hypothetical protein GCM10025868_07550 [Angustibacter aerolatus]